MTISEAQLRQADQERRAAQRAADAATERRNELVKQALAEGWTPTRIAAVVGVTKGRISQIRHRSAAE